MRKISKLFKTLLTVTTLSLSAEKTNVVLIVADDLGVECLPAYGGESYSTPNIDKLIKNGVKFNHCYSQPYSTSSRVKLMTGKYNFRNYTHYRHLDPKELTFSKLAKKAGYHTGIFGKWHLGGSKDDDFKNKWGWDEHVLWNVGSAGSRYRNPMIYSNGSKVSGLTESYGPDYFASSAVKFIKENKSRPFFLYYPMVLPHQPFDATPDCADFGQKGQRENNHFPQMISYMDKNIGKIFRAVKQAKIHKNTVIIFTSDNGTFRDIFSRQNGKTVRGADGFMTDAGTHVPLIVYWGHEIEQGVSSDALVDLSDVFATIAEVINADIPQTTVIDGVSFSRSLTNPDYSERSYIFSHFEPIKTGKRLEKGCYVRTAKFKLYSNGDFFDVTKDPLEQHPLNGETTGKKAYSMLKKAMSKMKKQGGDVETLRLPPLPLEPTKTSGGNKNRKKK